MTPKVLIKREFDKFIKEKFKHKETLYNFFKNHERKGKAIDGLCEQIQLAELRAPHLMCQSAVIALVRDMAKQFCLLALNTKEKEIGGLRKSSTTFYDEYGNPIDNFESKNIENIEGKDPGAPDGVLHYDRKLNLITDPNDGDKVIDPEKLK